jgi:hypothetical protein
LNGIFGEEDSDLKNHFRMVVLGAPRSGKTRLVNKHYNTIAFRYSLHSNMYFLAL